MQIMITNKIVGLNEKLHKFYVSNVFYFLFGKKVNRELS